MLWSPNFFFRKKGPIKEVPLTFQKGDYIPDLSFCCIKESSMIRITQGEMKVTCLLRCIKNHFKDNSKDLAAYEKYFVAFMSPIPFGYICTLSIVRLANHHPLGFIHVVSYKHLESSYCWILVVCKSVRSWNMKKILLLA